jgi:hypothetical protein
MLWVQPRFRMTRRERRFPKAVIAKSLQKATSFNAVVSHVAATG